MKTASQLILSLGILPFAALFAGCTADGDKTTDDSSTGPAYWCETLDDAQDYYIEDGGGNVSSGRIEGRIITSSSEDIHDVALVADLDYTLASVSSGGSPSLGVTTVDGDFGKTVGAGTWRVQASKSYAGKSCAADYTFEVVAEKTTYICVELVCQ